MNKQIITQAADKFDSQVNFKELGDKLLKAAPGWTKFVGGMAFNQLEKHDDDATEFLITALYNNVSEEYHPDLDAFLEAYVAGDLTMLQKPLVDRLVKAINTPLGDGIEYIWLNHISLAIIETMGLKSLPIVSLTDPGGGPSEPRP